jgi:hypothetical protein
MIFNEWFIISLVFLLLLATYHGGFFLGKKEIKVKEEGHSSRISNIQAGLMGLLGVMLAFSFSLSSQRFEERRKLVIQESMSIGTAYFRAGLLPDSLKNELRPLLKEYINQRINYYKSGNTLEKMREVQSKSKHIQVQIWAKTAILGKQSPNLNTNITILALNPMIDISENISSSFQSHVPTFILIVLILIATCTVLIIGYSHGLSADKNLTFMMILNIILCSILLLIMDLDSPNTGILQTDIYSLLQLKQEILKYNR